MNLPELISDARQGNKKAQKLLFDLLSGKYTMLCRRYVRNKQDAQEAIQDGFVNFFKGLPGFTFYNNDKFYAYAKTIMVNACLDFLRRNNTFYTVSEAYIPHTAVIEDVFADKEPHLIHKLIPQLPEGYSTILNLYAIDGYDHKEIGQALGITESTSRSQLTRARRALQEKLVENEKNNLNERSK